VYLTSHFIYQASSSHETMIKRITEAFHLSDFVTPNV